MQIRIFRRILILLNIIMSHVDINTLFRHLHHSTNPHKIVYDQISRQIDRVWVWSDITDHHL